MVCAVCGTRSPGDQARCVRCGARLAVPQPEPDPQPEREWSPAEKLALEARQQLAAGDLAGALRSAQRAAVMETGNPLCRLVLGEVYLQMEAPAEALREFRRAVELDPENAEAREKAEVARRRLVQRPESETQEPRDWRAVLIERKQQVSVAAGVVAGLLVFTIGAAAIVSRTSPQAQARRVYEAQIRLGREHYQAGRYEEAAQAFEQAWRLRPDSEEAKRRLDDALAMAGKTAPPFAAPQTATGTQVASILPLNDQSPLPPRWVGPPPRTPQQRSSAADLPPPPPIPEPPSRDAGSAGPDLPPPLPPTPTEPQVVESVTGPTRAEPPPSPQPVAQPQSQDETPPEPAAPAAPTTQRNPGRIVIQRHEGRPAARSATTNARPEPVPDAESLRREAERLQQAGNLEAAARKYSEAAARFREEAQRGGAGAAAKLSAATSCERARELCESQGN